MTEVWYFASKPGVTFAFSTVDGRVRKVAPIARRWMRDRLFAEVLPRLQRNGYEVSLLTSAEMAP